MEYELISPIKYSNPIDQIFTNRGFNTSDIEHYLNTTDEDILPLDLIDNLQRGAEMLIKHLGQNGKIYLQVDCDADGYTSAALLLNYLHSWVPSIVESKFIYGLHDDKTHGIDMDNIPEGTTLVIVPDASSEEYEKHEELFKRGIDVLIVDHHQADHVSEYACVINNQLCDYPNKTLCGAAMVYKFCKYLDSICGLELADNFVDLAAIALISDMIDIRNFETRRLITLGFNSIRNIFLDTLIQKDPYHLGKLTPINIAFYLVPLINAVVRSGTLAEKTITFEAMLDWKAVELIPSTKRGEKGQLEMRVTQAARNCSNIKKRQTDQRDQSLEVVEHLIEKNNLLDNKLLIIQLEEPINTNLTGLIANELMSKYKRPVALLNNRETGEWAGSARGYEKSKLTDFRQFCLDSQIPEYASGHGNAFGLSFLDDSAAANFIQYSNEKLKDIDFSPNYKVDFIYSANNFNGDDILSIANLNDYYGQNVDEPYIVIENITITKDNLYLMSKDKNPTLKITLPNGVALIKFKSSEEEYNNLYSNSGCVIINVVGHCASNEWNGKVTPQLLIENYDIINRKDYYF